MVKTPSCEKMGLKRGKWTVEEDELLVKYIQANGEGSWRSLPKNAGLLRCGKSCRLRWKNYLRPNLKRGKFTAEEDETIVKLHSSLGNRWSLIAQYLSGRTDNEIKNYWNSSLRRRIYIFRNLKELIKTTPNVPKITVDGDNDESLKKQDTTTRSKRGSIGCVLPRKDIVDDIGSSQKNNLSCLEGKDGATLSEGDSIESLLPKHCTVGMGSIQKSNSSYPGGKDNTMWSRVGSVESLLPENIENNSPCLGGKDNAMWSEEGSLFESLLLKNLKINFSYPRSTNNATWSEKGSIESFLLENYIVDMSFNRETNFSCLGSKDKATWSEEGSSIKLLLVENYIADLGLAMQQHEHHAKLETHEPRNEEEEEDKNNKDIHVITREQQVCNGGMDL